ncbi:MAG: C39 family peptidase [Ruminococcus sp.]|nr:C39 family peptidase [Ruminococcus sp.]
MTDSARRRLRRRKRQREIVVHSIMTFICIFILALVIYFAWALFLKVKGSIDRKYEKEITSTVLESEEIEEDTETERIQMTEISSDEIEQKLETYAKEHNFDVSEYPEELIELLRKNSETEQFVLDYPLKKDTYSYSALEETEIDGEMPLLMQWDERWGYYIYGDNVIGLTGCGPTCLSMVASYLLNDPELTPLAIAQFSVRNGYCVSGHGTSWELMSEGAGKLGLYSKEVPLHEETVLQYLQQGKPIISIMGEGDFTDNGHYIVFTGVENGKIKVNDPNSKERSEKLWDFASIQSQIKNMWVFE